MLTKSRVVEGCIFVLSRANQMLQVEIEKRDIFKKILHMASGKSLLIIIACFSFVIN